MLAHPQHADAIARGAECQRCPLYGCRQGPVPPRVKPGSTAIIIEESPGQQSVDEGVLLAGRSGMFLSDALAEGGVAFSETSVTAVTLCRPPGGHLQDYALELRRKAKKQGVAPVLPEECCAPRLKRDLEDSRARLVLTLGSESLKAAAHLLGVPFGAQKSPPGTARVAALKRQHGAPVLLPRATSGVTGDTSGGPEVLLGTFHPRFVFGSGNSTYLPVVAQDVRRAAEIACRLKRNEPPLLWRSVEGILNPTADVCVGLLDLFAASKVLVTVDIETDGIRTHSCNLRCVGLGANLPVSGAASGAASGETREVLIVVPWRHMDGRPWWTPGEQQRVGRALSRLDDMPLSGHNLAFDTAVLLQHGLLRRRNKHNLDTLVAHHHSLLSELPHDLGFVSSRYFDAPHWKDDADAKSVDGVDDYWLHRYCMLDVLGTMRLVPELMRVLHESGTVQSFVVDTKLGPIARDMGALGLHYDEGIRARFFHTLEAAGKERLETVQKVVGKPDFNPNSFRQVAKYLFEERGLSPPLSTTGEEWGDFLGNELQATLDPDSALDKAATNEPALLKLLDLGVDKQTEAFIEALLSYRGIRKCQSTYLGLKRDDSGQVQDVFRARDIMRTESHGPGLEKLSILHPAWRVTGAVSGRWSCQPGCQTLPERVVYSIEEYRKTKGASGILNTRAQVTAPPGYVLVGADYKAVELRLYAVQSGDAFMLEALEKELDPHALNYATMQSSKIDEVQKWYKRVTSADGKVKKYLRNIAKRFCIAEGESVLVRDAHGAMLERPIERVRTSDKVWDGVEWVSHDGVVFQGTKEVLFHDGLWATEDHEVFVEGGGTCNHGTAQRLGLSLKIGGLQWGAGARAVSGARRRVKVYDILNAGPRRRFTVSGRIVHNCFLVLYGGEKEKLFNTMSADRNPDGTRSFPDLKPADVQRWWNNWHKTHPETKQWQQRVVREFMRDGYVSAMIDGRKRFCAGGLDPNAAVNHTIQSSAAAITNRALIALAERCPYQGWGPLAGPILQVHDFLGLQVPLARQAEAEQLLLECMPYRLPNGFSFDIEQKSGPSWDVI